MFSGLANYLFGSHTTTDTNPLDTNTNSKAEEVTYQEHHDNDLLVVKKKTGKDKKRTHKSKREDKENLNDVLTPESDEDDWFFIDKEDGVEEIPRSESEEDVTIVEIRATPKPKHLRKKHSSKKRLPGKNSSPVRDYEAVSHSLYAVSVCPSTEPEPSANNSLVTICDTTLNIPANLSMEESWFLTPPPIFTSTGPINMELSPFENLLIEHPSMSVYHSIRSAREATESFVNLDLGVEESQSNSENRHSEPDRTPTHGTSVAVQQRSGNRVERLSATKPTKENVMFHKSQKAHENRDRQNKSRGAIKRGNNVCIILSKGSNRPRRSDLQHCKVLSGFNNNRKC